MTAPLHHPMSAARPDPVEVFELRAWARAKLYQADELDLHDAVDVLQRDAERDGLVDAIGQDKVQAILRDAFHAVRGDQ
jgi:hypothetical protein